MDATSNSRKIVIGDVHGQYDGLIRLLGAIAPSHDDRLCFVGDLIDRGPKSAQVVDFVMNSPYQCLLGNHEKMLLDILHDGQVLQQPLQAWLFSGGQTTLVSYQDLYGEPGIPHTHFDWFRSLPLYVDWGDYWIVHAGVDPTLPLDNQGIQQCCWIREPFHRCTQPYFADKTIVTGHTITFTLPGVEPGKIACGLGWMDIDTGAYHPRSGWLTGVDLTNSLVYQVNVYRDEVRVVPLADATVAIAPEAVATRS
jgi:serine/threonine protein phosphatase 1